MKRTPAARAVSVLLAVLVFLCPLVSRAETVITSFYPVWLIALNLTEGIDELDVVNLTESVGGCLHDYSLQPSDKVALSGADALLINGAGMESFLPVVLRDLPDLPVIDASQGIALLETDEEGEYNSHIWLDPKNTVKMASNLSEGLIGLFPACEDRILANLELFRERIAALQDTMRMILGETPPAEVLVFHEALPYFARACDLPVLASVSKEPEEDLSASQLARILELVRSSGTVPLILKSAEPDRASDVLAAETGATVCELDTLVSGPSDPAPDYYDTVMLQNLNKMLDAMRNMKGQD